MARAPLIWLCWTLLTVPTVAQPTIVAPQEPVPVGGFADVEINGLAAPNSLAWVVIPDTRVRVYSAWGSSDPILAIATNQKGTWTLVIAAIEDEKVWQQRVILQVGDKQPIPPDPDDPPTPPGPIGFRVLILREAQGDQGDFVSIYNSQSLRSYLNDKAKNQWHLWDDDYGESELEFVSQDWRDAYKQAIEMSSGKRPWLHVTNGVEGASVPLPTTVEEVLATLKIYGG